MSEAAEARVAWASKSQSGDLQFRRNHQASAFFQCLAEADRESNYRGDFRDFCTDTCSTGKGFHR